MNDFNNVTFVLGGAADDASFDGFIQDQISGAAGVEVVDVATVVKVGENTQALNGPNTYSGTTTVNGGTLLVNGTHQMSVTAGALPVGAYTVNSGGTLGGTGSVDANVSVFGGTLAPGASAGEFTINGNYSQDSSSTLSIEIGGPAEFDLLTISGTATLAGSLEISLLEGAIDSLTVGDLFPVLSATSVSGGNSLTLTGEAADFFSLDATSGNSLVLEFLGGIIVGPRLGDVNLDQVVDALDIAPFIDRVSSGVFQPEADVNEDAVVDALDIAPFIQILSGGVQAVAVPEPASALLALLALGMFGRGRKLG
jgi:autotransporter-associated beta strand protein